MMHNFWAVSDKMMAQMQMVMFFKNVSILGAALLIANFGSGAFSLDTYLAKRANRKEENTEYAGANLFNKNM
jgi:uncharacterized membrane protein YphA (DoxX/SURF4 family)